MKNLILIAVLAVCLHYTTAELSCADKMEVLCCSSANSWCTPEVYTAKDGDESCRCDSECQGDECCDDKEEECDMRREMMLEFEKELASKFNAKRQLRKKEEQKKEMTEKENLMNLLTALLKQK